MNLFKQCQIHRFSNRVAVSFTGDNGINETIYLTPDAAKDVSKAMLDCSTDIMTQEFGYHSFKTTVIK
jgi:hypothetical protein